MFTVYVVCSLVGGFFVVLAALGGLDGVDFDQDFDSDVEWSSQDSQDGQSQQRSLRWLWRSVLSLKFWTFGVCFFGLTGVALTWLGIPQGGIQVAGVAIGIGILCGGVSAVSLSWLRQQQVNSLVNNADYVGLIATVEIPVALGSPGKVRLQVKETLIDFTAATDNPGGIPVGQKVLVIEVRDNRLWVVPAPPEALPPSAQQPLPPPTES